MPPVVVDPGEAVAPGEAVMMVMGEAGALGGGGGGEGKAGGGGLMPPDVSMIQSVVPTPHMHACASCVLG